MWLAVAASPLGALVTMSAVLAVRRWEDWARANKPISSASPTISLRRESQFAGLVAIDFSIVPGTISRQKTAISGMAAMNSPVAIWS